MPKKEDRFGDAINTNGFDKRPEDATKGGRKPKIYTQLKDLGYSKDDIRACFGELVFYKECDLELLLEDENMPVISKVVAKALLVAVNSGDMSRIKDILEYSLGKPKQEIETDGPLVVNVIHTKMDKNELP